MKRGTTTGLTIGRASTLVATTIMVALKEWAILPSPTPSQDLVGGHGPTGGLLANWWRWNSHATRLSFRLKRIERIPQPQYQSNLVSFLLYLRADRPHTSVVRPSVFCGTLQASTGRSTSPLSNSVLRHCRVDPRLLMDQVQYRSSFSFVFFGLAFYIRFFPLRLMGSSG